MNAEQMAGILTLIGQLYSQVQTQAARIAELEAQLAQRQGAQDAGS